MLYRPANSTRVGLALSRETQTDVALKSAELYCSSLFIDGVHTVCASGPFATPDKSCFVPKVDTTPAELKSCPAPSPTLSFCGRENSRKGSIVERTTKNYKHNSNSKLNQKRITTQYRVATEKRDDKREDNNRVVTTKECLSAPTPQ